MVTERRESYGCSSVRHISFKQKKSLTLEENIVHIGSH